MIGHLAEIGLSLTRIADRGLVTVMVAAVRTLRAYEHARRKKRRRTVFARPQRHRLTWRRLRRATRRLDPEIPAIVILEDPRES